MKLDNNIPLRGIKKVIVSGVGGSAFSGDVLEAIAGSEIEIIVNRDYDLPENINRNTLVFAVSYSGNTEETLYAFKDAVKKRAKIISVTSGGELEVLSKKFKVKCVKVPSNLEPRNALGYLSIPMLAILQQNKLIKDKKLGSMANQLQTDQSKIQKEGKKIAGLLYEYIPLIYSSQKLKCLSYGWKTRLNENSKIHAFAHQFPELNHNELVGYTKKIANFQTIIIRDEDDFDRVQKRYDITKKLIENFGGQCTIIDTFGQNLLSRIFSNLHMADWASYYLALKYGIDPGPVNIIEDLKKELKR